MNGAQLLKQYFEGLERPPFTGSHQAAVCCEDHCCESVLPKLVQAKVFANAYHGQLEADRCQHLPNSGFQNSQRRELNIA